MAKKLNEHVMKNSFKEGLRGVYIDALSAAGVDLEDSQVKVHMWGSADVELTNDELESLRAHYESELEELSAHRNSGFIEIVLPAGLAFLDNNRPTLTEEERKAKQASGTGVNREEAERRKNAKAALRKRLAARHGINLDGSDETDDDSDE